MVVNKTVIKVLGLLLFLALTNMACSIKSPVQTQNLLPVEEEFRYEMEAAGEVTLVWGINGWGRIPADLISSETQVENELMHTPMVKEGGVFVAWVKVPAWSRIDYGFLITRLADGSQISPVWDGGEGYVRQTTEQDEIVEVQAGVELPASPAGLPIGLENLVDQEFKYRMPEAGEVTLVWGVDGWKPLPQSIRPSGTELKNNLMHTPMMKEGEEFKTSVRVPAGYGIDYGFLITRRANGEAIEPVWDGGEGYKISAEFLGQPVDLSGALSLALAQPAVMVASKDLLPVEIHYLAPDAGEVVLVWGIDGWQTLPEENRPAGTWVENKVMKTLMINQNGDFQITMHVPEGSKLEYGFLITRTQDGTEMNLWDGGNENNYRTDIVEPTTLQIASAINLEKQKSLPSTLVVGGYIFAGIVLIALVGFIFKRR